MEVAEMQEATSESKVRQATMRELLLVRQDGWPVAMTTEKILRPEEKVRSR